MNPLPVSLDLTSNSTSKSSAKTSASDVGADKFKNELNKQENNSKDKELSSKNSSDKAIQQNDTSNSAEAATVTSEGSVSGEELPAQVAANEEEVNVQGVDAEDVNRLEDLSDPLSFAELGISIDKTIASGAQNSLEAIDRVVGLTPSGEALGETMALEDEAGILRSLGVLAEEGTSQLAYSSPGTLAGSLNTIAANSVNAVSEDALLGQPLEKLMTLEQMKLSLEKGVETLAELEVDVDTDSEGTIREVFRFNDVQLKESQSSLKTYTTSVELPVSPGAWADKVNDKIVWLANQKIQFAEIHLNPQDLGPMEVKINVQNDQATVTFNSQHQGVRELLELNVNRLREMMSENGVDLAHVDVSDQSSQHQPDDEHDGDVAGQSGEGDDELSGLDDARNITDSITLNNLVDYYA